MMYLFLRDLWFVCLFLMSHVSIAAEDGSTNSHHHLGSRDGNRSSKSHHRHTSIGGSSLHGVDGSVEEDLDANESEMDSDQDPYDREFLFISSELWVIGYCVWLVLLWHHGHLVSVNVSANENWKYVIWMMNLVWWTTHFFYADYGYTDSSDDNTSRPNSHTPRLTSSSMKRNTSGNATKVETSYVTLKSIIINYALTAT